VLHQPVYHGIFTVLMYNLGILTVFVLILKRNKISLVPHCDNTVKIETTYKI